MPQVDQLKRGDIVFFEAREDSPRAIRCLNDMVSAMTNTPFVHCAVVIGFDDSGEPLLGDATLGGGAVSTLSSLSTHFGPTIVVSKPIAPDDAEALADAIEELVDPEEADEDRRVRYAQDRLLHVAVLAGAKYSEFESERARETTLALAEMATQMLSQMLDPGVVRAMCAELVAVAADAASVELELVADADERGARLEAVNEALGVASIELPENFLSDCTDDLAAMVSGIATTLATSPDLTDAGRAYFAELSDIDNAAALIEHVVAASTDPEAATAVLALLDEIIAEMFASGRIRTFTDDPTVMIDCGHLLTAGGLTDPELLTD